MGDGMNWIDIVWPMISGACATLAAVHVIIWFRQRDQRANLAFAVAALSLAMLAILELLMMRAQTPHTYELILQWSFVPITMLVLGLVGFFLFQFHAGSRRLAVLAVIARVASLLPNFLIGENLVYLDIGSLYRFPAWGGGVISIPGADAVANPWFLLDSSADILLLLFIASVIVDLLRQEPSSKRRRALAICGAAMFFVIFAQGWNFAVVHLDLRGPLILSPAFLLVLLVMGNELGSEMLRARQLAQGLSAAELALVDTRRQMDVAVSAAGVGLWSWDKAGGASWFSDISVSILGYRPGLAIDMDSFRARLLSADRKRFDATLQGARDNAGMFVDEYRIVLPDGRTRAIAARGQVEFAPDESPLRVHGAIVDITYRKEAEDRFRQVVQATPTAMLMFDPEGKIVLANPQAQALFGFTVDELTGMGVEQVVPEQSTPDRRHRPRLTAGIAAMRMAIGSGSDLSGRRKDGSEVPIKIVLNPIPIESQLYMLAAITDLSEKNRFERELALQRDELAHLSRVALLSELSGSLAHELNQPLTAILANAQGAIRFLARDPPDLEEVRSGLVSIVESDKRAGEVIRRLRALLRKDRAEFRYLGVNEVIEGVLKIVRSDLLNKHIEIVTDFADGLPMVCGDVVQLQQVLLNLIVNASDAMADTSARQVTLQTVLAAPEQVIVSVSDAGHGIPGEDPDSIFTPFVSTKQDGLGLGLAVCRTIITAHQGTIWAANNEGFGATVSFSLPVSSKQAQPATTGAKTHATMR